MLKVFRANINVYFWKDILVFKIYVDVGIFGVKKGPKNTPCPRL